MQLFFLIILNNYYWLYRLFSNRKSSYCVAQAQSCGNGPRHLAYALVYSREYKKDLILMCIKSQLRTVFFVFALFVSLSTQRANAV